MAVWPHALLAALLGLVCFGYATAQAQCTPGAANTCSTGYVCSQNGVCVIPPSTETIQTSNMTAYIILGSILGVIVIIVIVILVISCGRWNWNWRTAGDVVRKRTMIKAARPGQGNQRGIRTKKLKPKLKLGVKANDFPRSQSDNSNGSTALFVLGENEQEPEANHSYRTSGPHVARVDLDEKYVPPPEPIQQPSTSQRSNNGSNPNVSRYPDVHIHYPNPAYHNIDMQPHLPMQGIYPQLGSVNNLVTPQHQINIHSTVPSNMSGTTMQQVPTTLHHQQIVTQPGLYPQLGQAHAQIIHAGHVIATNGSQTMGPPAYQTMERTDVKY